MFLVVEGPSAAGKTTWLSQWDPKFVVAEHRPIEAQHLSATGQPFDPPADFVEASYGLFQVAVNEDLRAAGLFGPPYAVASDAPALTKLLAHAGRRA